MGKRQKRRQVETEQTTDLGRTKPVEERVPTAMEVAFQKATEEKTRTGEADDGPR